MDLRAIAAVVPLGLFTVVHVLVQATALAGHERWSRVVGTLARTPLATIAEIAFVAVPLAVHAATSVPRVVRWPADAAERGYGRPGLDLLIRVASVPALLFFLVHGWSLRGHRVFGGGSINALGTRLSMQLSTTSGGMPWIALAYVGGIAAVSFHLAYGAFALATRAGRGGRAAAAAAIAGGGLVFAVATATVVTFATGSAPLRGGAEAGPSLPCGDAAPVGASR